MWGFFMEITMYQRMKHAKLSRAFKDNIISSCSNCGNANFLDVCIMCLMGGEL